MIFMKHLNFFCVLLLIFVAGCKPKSSAPNAKSYEARGVIRQIAPDKRTVTIQHEAIAGYMGNERTERPRARRRNHLQTRRARKQ
jgi:Cu/Ag efflux protein CusF